MNWGKQAGRLSQTDSSTKFLQDFHGNPWALPYIKFLLRIAKIYDECHRTVLPNVKQLCHDNVSERSSVPSRQINPLQVRHIRIQNFSPNSRKFHRQTNFISRSKNIRDFAQAEGFMQ